MLLLPQMFENVQFFKGCSTILPYSTMRRAGGDLNGGIAGIGEKGCPKSVFPEADYIGYRL